MKCPACGDQSNHVVALVRGTNEPIYRCQLSRVVFAEDGSYRLEPVEAKS